MTTPSPWSLQPTTETITDEHGHSMAIPSYGSWLVDEIVGVQSLYAQYADKDASDIELYSAATAFLLHSRGILDSADSALLKGMPLSLLLAVWGFFQKENATLGSSEGPKGKRKASVKSIGKSKQSPPATPSSQANDSDVPLSITSEHSSGHGTTKQSTDTTMKGALQPS